MKRKLIIFGVIPIVLLSLLLIYSKGTSKIFNLRASNFSKTIKNDEFSLVYYGELNDHAKEKLKNLKRDYKISVYTSNIESSEYKDIFGTDNNVPLFDFFIEGQHIYTIDDEISDEDLVDAINKYFYSFIPEGEIYYKIAKNATEYKNKVESKNYTIAIFGYGGCKHCNLFKPVFNDVAHKNKLDIYYFDRDIYDKSEYEKIMNLDLSIFSDCTLDNKETSFKQGFPKPMTIITKNGKTVGCMLGYVTEEEFVIKLKEVGVVK